VFKDQARHEDSINQNHHLAPEYLSLSRLFLLFRITKSAVECIVFLCIFTIPLIRTVNCMILGLMVDG
jgi:hypothetical protein